MTSIVVALDRMRLTPDADDCSEIVCPCCDDCLVVHQPDAQLPERLLGTCSECHAWFLIDATSALLVRLPDEDALRGF